MVWKHDEKKYRSITLCTEFKYDGVDFSVQLTCTFISGSDLSFFILCSRLEPLLHSPINSIGYNQ